MVFTGAQLTAFFENNPQMALNPTQRQRLADEGLALVSDFQDFKEDELEQAYKNMRISIPGVAATTDATGNIIAPAIQAIPPCIIPARCILRLKIASIAYQYYINTGREVNSTNMHYSNILRKFHTEWEALKKLSKQDRPDVPVLSKIQTPVKWMESFTDFLSRIYGVRNCPITYVIREEDAVKPETDEPLLHDQPYSEEGGSVRGEMIRRLSHTHTLFKEDNSLVYSLLDEATSGTIYAPTIKPYGRTNNGREAWKAIISSHAGDDKWEKIQRDRLNFIMNVKWNGRTYSLEKFTGLHRSAYTALEEAALHVNFQLPNERSRVGYLLENITNSDPDLRAALASIRANVNNMRSSFEASIKFLLPVCPYIEYKSNNRNPNISDFTLKGKSDSKTGVDFRWHTREEYAKLSKEQRSELYNWQKSAQGKATMKATRKSTFSNNGNMDKKQLRSKVASLEKELESARKLPTLDEITACIAAAQIPRPTTSEPPPPSTNTAANESNNKRKGDTANINATALSVQSILKRHKS